MITDTLELDDDEIEEEAQGEVDKVLHELTDGKKCDILNVTDFSFLHL